MELSGSRIHRYFLTASAHDAVCLTCGVLLFARLHQSASLALKPKNIWSSDPKLATTRCDPATCEVHLDGIDRALNGVSDSLRASLWPNKNRLGHYRGWRDCIYLESPIANLRLSPCVDGLALRLPAGGFFLPIHPIKASANARPQERFREGLILSQNHP